MRLRVTIVAVALALGACAGAKDQTGAAHDPFVTLPFAPDPPRDAAPAPDVAQTEAFTIEVSFERASGQRLAAPRVTVLSGQTAAIVVGQPAAPASGDPPPPPDTARMDGVHLDLGAVRAADGGVTLGFRVRLAKLGDAEHGDERVEAEGTRWMEPGCLGLLARATSPDGSGPILVLARVVPIRVDAPPPDAGSDWPTDGALVRPMSGHTVHLRVTAVQIGRDVEPGSVIDETAAPDVLKSAGGRVLRDFEIFSCLDSRVRLAGLVDAAGKTHGLVATGRDDGKLDISWTTTDVAHTATIRPNAGRRFVALARVEGGSTAGAIVSVDSDD